LPGAGLAVKPVAFWVTASMMLCWPRAAMVSAVITSTLAGVCSGVRLSRLPVDVGVFKLKVGVGWVVAAADEAAAAVAAGFAPLRRDRLEDAARRSSARRLVATCGGGLLTTTGSSSRIGAGACCARTPTGKHKNDRATEHSIVPRRDA